MIVKKILFYALLISFLLVVNCARNIRNDFIMNKYDIIKYYEYNFNTMKIFDISKSYNKIDLFSKFEIKDIENYNDIYLKIFLLNGKIIQMNFCKENYLSEIANHAITRVYYNDKDLPVEVQEFNKQNELKEYSNPYSCWLTSLFVKTNKFTDEFTNLLKVAKIRLIYDENNKLIRTESFDKNGKLLFTNDVDIFP